MLAINLFKSVVFCSFLAIFVAGQGSVYRKDYVYSRVADAWIKYHRIPATWHDARLRCKYEGAVLASPITEGLFAAMTDQLANGTTPETQVMFIGVHATFSKGDFASIEGVPVSEMPLLQFSSACFEGTKDLKLLSSCFKDCLVMAMGGKVHTAECRLIFPYMCVKSGPVVPTMCGGYDYQYDSRTKKCYKIHTIGRGWAKGFMTCMAEGGHLAIINSDIEAKVIKELFERHPNNTIVAEFKDVASIGMSDWGERTDWWTIHGETLDEAGYSIWETDVSKNLYQYCGGVNRSEMLRNIWCNDRTYPLICEKSPILH